MAVLIDSAADHNALFADLKAFLVDTDPDGPEWVELDSDSTRAIYEAPGLSGTEQIYVGIGVVEDIPADAFAIKTWMFRAYNAALDFEAQPGMSIVGYHPVWNTTTPYWFVANGQRLIMVTKISTVYTASYLGKILPYGTPGEWPQPYYKASPQIANTRWSSVSESYRNFWDPGGSSGQHQLLNPNGNWYTVANFVESGGESNRETSNFTWPYQARMAPDTASVQNHYRKLRENVDGTYPLWPIILLGEDPNDDLYGELDGAFACSGFGAASEDIMEIGGDDYLLVQNIFRTARYYYTAIKLA